MHEATKAFDCEFTLALSNRTGKYFFCKDMIDASRDLIRSCYYWRIRFNGTFPRIIARLIARLCRIEVDHCVKRSSSYNFIPLVHHRRPMVFTDPRECVRYLVKSCDVVLCHDMGPLTHPALYDEGVGSIYALAFDRIRSAKPFMLFVSDASRQAFTNIYGNDFPLLQVIHIPLRDGLSHGQEQSVSDVPEKFFLTVGSIGTRKNQFQSIKAFEASGLAKDGYGYVICGGPEPGADEVISLAHEVKGISLLGYVSDSQLKWLYRNARGFILASLLEGFGMPAAEAIHYGQVPLLSAGGALEEVAGDGAIYVNPKSAAEIAAGMRSLASMTMEERESRLLKMRMNISKFSSEAAVSIWRSTLALALGSPQRSGD